jgi:hypothetical protein
MNRSNFVLAALSTAEGRAFTPVQVQKLFFVLDRNIPNALDEGEAFHFVPYDYGPFDSDVYRELEHWAYSGMAEVTQAGQFSMKTFRLTALGQREGERLLQELPERFQAYIREVSMFVRSLSFSDLVSAIYKAYPEMKANSVFREP